jgi:GntR family transcriptional repressor for pyruvate dehydrogenase complex
MGTATKVPAISAVKKGLQVERELNLPVRVAKLISSEIIDGRLRPGDRVPTEQELSAMFGVSKNVVREAIARLRSEGVLRSRQGAGVFVAEAQARSAFRIEREDLQDFTQFQRLFELRGILEIEAAGLAAARRTKEELKAIDAAMQQLRDDANSIDADLNFHRAVSRAAGNNYIATFISFISEHVRETIAMGRSTLDPEVNAKVQVKEHGAIHEAIAKGDPAQARSAMRKHLANAAKRLSAELALRLPRKIAT